jgi:hypothetical protein
MDSARARDLATDSVKAMEMDSARARDLATETD